LSIDALKNWGVEPSEGTRVVGFRASGFLYERKGVRFRRSLVRYISQKKPSYCSIPNL